MNHCSHYKLARSESTVTRGSRRGNEADVARAGQEIRLVTSAATAECKRLGVRLSLLPLFVDGCPTAAMRLWRFNHAIKPNRHTRRVGVGESESALAWSHRAPRHPIGCVGNID